MLADESIVGTCSISGGGKAKQPYPVMHDGMPPATPIRQPV